MTLVKEKFELTDNDHDYIKRSDLINHIKTSDFWSNMSRKDKRGGITKFVKCKILERSELKSRWQERRSYDGIQLRNTLERMKFKVVQNNSNTESEALSLAPEEIDNTKPRSLNVVESEPRDLEEIANVELPNSLSQVSVSGANGANLQEQPECPEGVRCNMFRNVNSGGNVSITDSDHCAQFAHSRHKRQRIN